MGVEYYVVDKKKRIFYELGKGGWFALNDDLEAFQVQDYLAEYLLMECLGLDHECSDYEDWRLRVNVRIAPELHEHFGDSRQEDLSVINDCGDDYFEIRCRNYRCVGSRFYEHGSEQYKDNMEHLNRHLDPKRSQWFSMRLDAESKWA